MKTKTKISYVILKYDDQTDNIFTKTLNNENHVYEVPSFQYVQKRDADFDDVRTYILEKVIDFNTYIDENHIFIPFVNVTFEKGTVVYDYVAVIFESNQNTFSSMNYEAWHRVKYNRQTLTWDLPWGSGLNDPVDFKFRNTAISQYRANPKNNNEVTFSNVMRFVTEQINDFPILGLMSGNQFTMKQVLHYQDLLGIDVLKAGNNATFENQYSNSIRTIEDDHMTTSYQIKSEYLQK
ncbi:hypothetical protein [Companilactobacillus kimchiensis]|uniref:Uncharacterized protein n=1 Tax=Companilactobacillus kimchiensis TaxID=993692 RepID=A0A0R2LJR1_9LACO|nr:hypothetical protein [Companilactobacillus kimchiensis]KRN99207.1 hypothetical protein IV57_GL000429 [Companilactobacillus kimchiensis]